MTLLPLNPCDYFLLMLDEAMRREGVCANTCVAILRMAEVPSTEELRAYAADLVRRHPVLDSRLAFSPFLRQAHWIVPGGVGIPVIESAGAEEALNRPMDPRSDAPVELHRLPGGVAVRWHHALMDAKGGERMLAGGGSDVPKGEEFSPDLARHGWWKRVRMSLRARRRFHELDRTRPANFDHHPRGGTKRLGLRLDTFEESETAAMLRRAADSCGALQRNLYFLAATFRALSTVVKEDGPLVVPLPVDLRKKEWSPVVANYLTFFHFVVPRNVPTDVPALARFLREFQIARIREQDDAAMIALLHLGRRLSLGRYLRERTTKEGRERVTAYFSFPGESGVTEFLGRPVLEYRPFPAVPARPGVGVFWSLHGGKLQLTTVFVRENVEEAVVETFLRSLKESL